jgi:multicomponent Na+:H+ antiporter subunit B
LKRLAFVAVLLTGALLLYGIKDFPAWGDPMAPAAQHLSSTYIEKGVEQTHVPNIVTAVLGDYRGYDTMFETVVIYCAGIVVIGALRGWREDE